MREGRKMGMECEEVSLGILERCDWNINKDI
jgi:hypothetical protein